MKIREIIKRAGTILLSVLCAFCCFLTPVTTIALAAGVGEVISTLLEFASTCSEVYSGIVQPLISAEPGALRQAKYICAWMDIIDKYNLSEEDFKAYYTEIATNGEYYALGSDEYNTWLFITETAANGVSLDAICELAFRGTGKTDYTINHNADDNNKFQITGKALKDVVADYNSRYSPMDNPEQFIWSYNSDNSVTKTKQDRSQRFYFFPQVPVYAGSSGTWGNQKWTDFYLIGFAIDDISGVYYGKYYVHVYTKNENGSVSLITDYYSLSDGSLYQTRKGTWDIGNYPYLSMHYGTGSSMFSFRGYKSASAYYGDVTASWKTIVTSNVAMPLSASDNSGTLEFTKYVALPSFTPDTNKSDDYGFICSSKQFELFANQTGIDFQKIPDNYIITINGNTIYNYPITDPSTGNSTTINKFIINNYIITGGSPSSSPYPDDPKSDGPITSGVKVSGNVKVDGEINIKADPIQIKTDPIDINVNVNQGGSSGGSGSSGTSEHVDISGYLDTLPEQSKTLTDYLKIFFDFLPPELLAVLLGGIGAAVLCRVLGR